jgi:hypothetical protein
MPDLVILFGPPASGKAAVGHALAQITGFRFFHNHMTAEAVAALFGWGTPEYSTVAAEVRLLLLSKALAQKDQPSVIFTFVWAFNLEADNRFIADLMALASSNGQSVYFVELMASQAARVQREGTPFRLEHKPAKRNIERARTYHAEIDARQRMNSMGDFPHPANHLSIDTEMQSADQSALIVAKTFGFAVRARDIGDRE